ncbi:hypothetical protein [Fluviicola sp.]|uniref:hypothetical protein n=1 Tax=Fluviicola sp. TaxID=1917219 RepID=UPI0026344889|nr:hypothetical protein [Fluviicola sp.]
MENYKKDFIHFEQVINPTVKTELLLGRSYQFDLGYRRVNERGKDFMMKFRILVPKSRDEAVVIIHGYKFSVHNTFVINQNLEKVADFFTFLVLKSLKQVNKSLPEGKIELPPHKSLLKAILLMLISRSN